jgi:small conductance mechanosensitive channel
LLSTPLQVVAIAFGTYLLIRVSNLLIDRFSGFLKARDFEMLKPYQRLDLRVSTVSRVLKNVTDIVLVGIAALAILAAIGFDLVPLLAGAGIVGLAISFAAQGLIKDVINGFLIIFEDQYAVGDVIVLGELGGLVENMNLRITQIRNNEGQLITIPNSSITIVQNLSKDWARVDLSIRVAYDTNPDHALDILRKLAQEIYQEQIWRAKIIEPPEVLGIDDLQHSGMLIRTWIKTQPLQQWAVAREFRRRLKLVMEQEGIAIGIPQQSLFLENTFTLDPEK